MNFLNAIKDVPHPEERLKGASRRTHLRHAALQVDLSYTQMLADDDGRAMKALPMTPELLRVARRVMSFEEPERAFGDPVQFLAHVMVLVGSRT
jgi:hypothetical protein